MPIASTNRYPFWKGRVALYAILRAMDLEEGDEVVVPGYTCVMVPGAVVYAGGIPVYADVDPVWCNVRADEVERLITTRTRAVLVQHTYGYPAPVAEISELTRPRGITIIEDCCHTYGGTVNGQVLGTLGIAAFFSMQWNKTFTTGLGGFADVNDPDLARRVREIHDAMPEPPAPMVRRLSVQVAVHRALVRPAVNAAATAAFRFLTKRGAVVGSATADEFSPTMPSGYAYRASRYQIEHMERQLAAVEANMAARRRNAQIFREALPSLGFEVPAMPADWDPVMVRYPVRVANKEDLLHRAVTGRVEIGSWFEAPLHPAETNHEAFGYTWGQCPVAEQACREIINLPLHPRVTQRDIDRTLAFLKRHAVRA